MKPKILILTIFVFLLVPFISIVSAIPGIPHQFYGSVTVNGQPAPDNQILVAEVDGDLYYTIVTDGNFGYAPNSFFIEDPVDGSRKGELITFYLGTKSDGSTPGKQDDSKTTIEFEKDGYDNLNLEFKTSFGDRYCLGEETCSNNPVDCGICTDPPIITIISPENNKVYNTAKVDLIVKANQPISSLIWMYAFNSKNYVLFTPNIILTAYADENGTGVNNLSVLAFSQQNPFNFGIVSVQFTVDIPYCGDLTCNSEFGESCSNCATDCGVCPSGGGGGGSGGGGGGGGGGSIPLKKQNNTLLQTGAAASSNVEVEVISNEETSQTEIQEGNKNTMPGITGAVIGFAKSGTGLGIIIAIVILIIGITAIATARKGKN